MKSDPKESGLLEGLAKSDRQAVEIIYSRHFAMIQSLVLNNNGTSDDARDIFQEGMIVLYERARSEGFELNCQISTYLYSVCRRLWLKRLSQLHRFSPHVNGVEDTVPVEEDLELHEQQNRAVIMMEKAMANIGEPCRSLLEAFYLQKKNMTEIAASFGYTNPENAKNQKYKCLMRLKKIFFTEFSTRK